MRVIPSLSALVLALAVAATPLAASAQRIEPGWIMPAQERGRDGEREHERERQQLRPIREVLDSLRDRYGGEYVSYRLEDGPRPIYVIRWRMPDGVTTRDFRVNATSGQAR
jgi:uncharacterized membrane protein YkoI